MGYAVTASTQLAAYQTAKRAHKAELRAQGVLATPVRKVAEGRPHIVDKIIDREIDLVFNTTSGRKAIEDSYSIRRETLMHGIPYFTALTSCRAAVAAIEALQGGPLTVKSLQEYQAAMLH